MLTEVLILDPPEHSVADLQRAFESQVPEGCAVERIGPESLLERLGPDGQLVVMHVDHGDRVRPGLRLVDEVRLVSPDTPIVLVADRGDVDSASRAIRAGATDFLVRGPKLAARVGTLLGKLQGLLDVLDRARSLDTRNSQLQEAMQARFRIVGESPQILALIERARAVAQVPRPVLVTGERGTGKELVARTIHFSDSEPSRPIISVNCAAFSDALLESELFGHEKGAFTGADETRHGKFAQANGGTLFLDEIAHMSLSFQRKILRVVEYGTYTRVGGHRELKTTARIVAATNADLKPKIRDGEFLGDLYDRLAFEVIAVPPLRQREGDIEVLALHFLNQFSLEIPAFRGKSLAASALSALRKYSFPGNVRELKNIIERAAYRDTTNEITSEDIGMLSEEVIEGRQGSFHERVQAFRHRLIREALKEAGGNQARAARLLGLSYHQFRYYLGKSGRRTKMV